MMNNNTQVSPRNGVDFSRIRKAKFGTQIPKFLGGGIPLWYLNLYSNNSALTGWNKNKNSSFAGATIYGTGGSSLHGNAGDLDYAYRSNAAYTGNHDQIGGDIQYWYNLWAKENPTATPEQMVQAYNTIAERIRQYQTQGHSYGDTGARTNNKDFINLFHSRSFKEDTEDKSNDMSFIGYQENLDDIYGSSSFLRRMDRYEKEYENLSDTEKAARTFTIKMGDKDVQVYKKANGDIALLPSTVSDRDESTITNNNAVSTSVNATPEDGSPVKLYSPVEYDPTESTKRTGKFNFPTFPLYNAALYGIGALTNKGVLDTQLKAPTMRYEAPTLYGKVTDAYAERTGNQQALERYKWGVQEQLDNTNDLGRAQEVYRDVLGKQLDVDMANNKAKQDEYNQTSLNLQQISNTNKQNWTNTANLNRLSYVADMRDRLNKISQYKASMGQLAQENVMANYTDWKAWNRNNQLQDYADWQSAEGEKVQNDLQKAWQLYQDSGDITKYKPYEEFWNSISLENGNPDPNSKFGTAYVKYLLSIPGAKATDPELRKKFFLEHMNDDFGGELDAFKENWKQYQQNAAKNYNRWVTDIQNRWGLLKNRYSPINFSGEISSWLYGKLNPKPTYNPYDFLYMAKGGRFLEYLRHNRRAEKEIRDTTMKSMSESRKMLRRDLDALDRESLLLLRAIFK